MGTNGDIVSTWYPDGPVDWTPASIDLMAEQIWHPEIEWRAIEGAPDDVGVMNGRERLTRYYGEWFEMFEDIVVTRTEQTEVGELVVSRFHVSAVSRSTGMPLDLDFGAVYELEGGLLRRGREFATYEAAIEAARSWPAVLAARA
jgi:ketosteroid isomerase-like protein